MYGVSDFLSQAMSLQTGLHMVLSASTPGLLYKVHVSFSRTQNYLVKKPYLAASHNELCPCLYSTHDTFMCTCLFTCFDCFPTYVYACLPMFMLAYICLCLPMPAQFTLDISQYTSTVFRMLYYMRHLRDCQ